MGLTNLPGLGTLLVGVTCFISFVAFILHAVSFSTRDWLVSVEPSPFTKIGWHRACFEDCRYPYCPGGSQLIYDGCWWIYDYYFQTLRQRGWLLPDWYLNVRILVIINVPVTFIGFLLTAFATCLVGMWRYPRHKTPKRDRWLYALVIVGVIFFFCAALMMLISVAIFAMNAFSHNWMPMPDKNALGYSYWLEVSAAILLMICVVTGISSLTFKWVGSNTPKEAQVAEDMMMGVQLDTLRLPTIPEEKGAHLPPRDVPPKGY